MQCYHLSLHSFFLLSQKYPYRSLGHKEIQSLLIQGWRKRTPSLSFCSYLASLLVSDSCLYFCKSSIIIQKMNWARWWSQFEGVGRMGVEHRADEGIARTPKVPRGPVASGSEEYWTGPSSLKTFTLCYWSSLWSLGKILIDHGWMTVWSFFSDLLLSNPILAVLSPGAIQCL